MSKQKLDQSLEPITPQEPVAQDEQNNDSTGTDQSRRAFLGKVGAATALGVGGMALMGKIASQQLEASEAPTVNDPNTKRWGMVIDMSKCEEDCNDCSVACHTKHNVPDHGNPKDEVKWIWKEKYKNVFTSKSHQFGDMDKPFLTLCNHCENPPCVRVCPTQATFKRDDGIVQMDFHRCIGCRFCMAGCPYGSRSFNWIDPRPNIKEMNPDFPSRSRGVVEKCNFCAERLDRGEQPHCEVACDKGVVTFGNLNDPESNVRKLLAEQNTIQRKPELGTKPSVFYIV